MNPNKALWEKGDLEARSVAQSQSSRPGTTSIPATLLRVTVAR